MILRALPILFALLVAGCGGNEDAPSSGGEPTETFSHVHGIGVNPADGAVFIATHDGLFRAARGKTAASRVGDERQDTMGFTVIGPDQFLGSGHPDARSDSHPLLGLIESRDAGKTWRPVLLEGEADFHAMDAGPGVFYAHDAHGNRLFRGTPGASGLTQVRRPPGTLIDLAADPKRSERVVASTDRGLFASRDGGLGWRALSRKRTGLVAQVGDELVLVEGDGTVRVARRAGGSLRQVGRVEGPPAAMSADGNSLLVAVQEGPIMESTDGGRTWKVRVAA